MVGILFWSSEHACGTSLIRECLSIQILVLGRSLPGFGQSSSYPGQTHLCLNGDIHGSLKLRALFVLYAKKTQKRYITTSLSVSLLGIIIILCGLT